MSTTKSISKYCILLVICIVLPTSYYMSIGMEWWDQINYISLAKSIANNGHIFPFSGYNYDNFLQNNILTPIYKEYPNYMFVCLYAVIIKIFGFKSLLPFYFVNIIMSIFFILAFYNLLLYITKNYIQSCLFVFVYTLSPCFLYLTFGGRTEICLLFFFSWAILFAMKNQLLYAGLALGIGFCFREQAIMFVPILPLCINEKIKIRNYFILLCKTFFAFCFGIVFKFILYYIFFSGPSGFFYLNEHAELNITKLAIYFLYNSVKSIFIFTHMGSLLIFIPFIICFCCLFFVKTKTKNIDNAVKFSVISIVLFYLPLFRYGIDMELRFLIYSCIFSTIALLFFINNFNLKHDYAIYCIIGISCLLLYPRLNDGIDLNENFKPVDFFSGEKNKIILTNSPATTNYVFENPITISLPRFKKFFSTNNNKIDYIVLTTKLNGNGMFWFCGDSISDNFGNKFILEKKFNCLKLRVYKRALR